MLMNTKYLYFNNFSKNQKNDIRIFSGKRNSIIKMENYEEAKVKLTNTQLNKLDSAAKNKTGTILRINKENVQVD